MSFSSAEWYGSQATKRLVPYMTTSPVRKPMVGSPRVIDVSPLMLRAMVQMTWAIAPAAIPKANDAAAGRKRNRRATCRRSSERLRPRRERRSARGRASRSRRRGGRRWLGPRSCCGARTRGRGRCRARPRRPPGPRPPPGPRRGCAVRYPSRSGTRGPDPRIAPLSIHESLPPLASLRATEHGDREHEPRTDPSPSSAAAVSPASSRPSAIVSIKRNASRPTVKRKEEHDPLESRSRSAGNHNSPIATGMTPM